MTNPDPQKNALWMDARVRQGLSVAINRDEINKVVFLGQGTPGSVTFGRFTDLPIKPEWERAFAQFDMAMANRLLDQAGLNKRGANNVRLMPDGRPFNVVIEYGSASASTIVDTLELVEEYWEAVGVDVLLKAQAGNILGERDQQDASEIQVQPGGMVNYRVHKSSKKWNQWLGADLQIKSGQRTMADFPNGMPGVEPPAWVKHWFDLEQKYWNLPLTSPEAIAAANEISDFFAKEMITIGTVGYIPHLVVAKNTIGNIPTAFPPGSSWHGNLNRMIETLYFK
jgi:peptide/nickel transport system substrate-binding protein